MTYRYRDLGKYLVCVDQSGTSAARNLLLGFNRNKLNSLGITKPVAWNAIKVVAKERLHSRSSNSCVILPAFGQLGMKVHRGYKLFDFDKSQVTKVFAAGVSRDEADQEIAASREASAVSMAPRFLAADPDSISFSEEYVRGTHATDLVSLNSSDYLRYYADVEKCLLELLACRRPIVRDAEDYINFLTDDGFRNRWLQAGVAREEVDRISTYMQQLRSWLAVNIHSAQLQLVRTHGDFSLVNAISTGAGLRFIDWEGIGPGSLYSDLYNFMFAERYYDRCSPGFLSEVLSVIERFRSAVVERHPALRDAAMMDQAVVRRLYYLERVRLMMNREVTPVLHRVVEKSIALFQAFDTDAGDGSL